MFYLAYALEVVAAVVMIIAVMSFFSITLSERAGEISTIHQLGATRRQLIGTLLWEAAIVGLLGSSLGCAIGIPLAQRMTWTTMRLGGGFEFDFVLPAETVAATILGAVLVCALAVLLQVLAGSTFRRALLSHGGSAE
jgi:putative ABC transport system permease protein